MNHDDEQLSRLYQQISKAEPSKMVDARIHRTAQQTGVAKRRSRLTRLLSVAAVLVLSVGVVLRVVEETPVKQDFEEQIMTSEPTADQSMSMQRQASNGLDDAMMQSEKEAMDGIFEKETKASRVITDEQSGNLQIESLSKQKPEQQPRQKSVQKKVAPAAAAPIPAPETEPQHAADAVGLSSNEAREAVLSESDIAVEAGFTALSESWCGQDDLVGVNDRQLWLARLEQLKQLKQFEKVTCIENLLDQQLAQ